MKDDYSQVGPFDHDKYGARPRRFPKMPDKTQRIKLLVDTDAGVEVDDQYGISLALLMPERFDIKGFTAVNWGSPDTIGKTVEEVSRLLDVAGQGGKYPVLPGGPPLVWDDYCVKSDAAEFIIEEALAASPADPLYLAAIGRASNVAAAYMMNPDIADNIVLLYHTRSVSWPQSSGTNVIMDLRAARTVFHSNIPLVMYDTGSYIRISMEESERRIKPHGRLGEYLHQLRLKVDHWTRATKGMYDLGDIVFLADASSSEWEEISIPTLMYNGHYKHDETHGRGLRVHHTMCKACWDVLEDKLRLGAS